MSGLPPPPGGYPSVPPPQQSFGAQGSWWYAQSQGQGQGAAPPRWPPPPSIMSEEPGPSESRVMPSRRASQRPTLSCTECARRKIKCDKKIPCEPCKKRGRERSCFQEQWIQPGSDQDVDNTTRSAHTNLTAEVAALKRQIVDLETLRPRVARLEALISAPPTSHLSSPMAGAGSGVVSPSASTIGERLRTGAVNPEGNEDPSVQFEHLALGHVAGLPPNHRHTISMSATPSDAISPTSSGQLFKAQSDSIIDFALSIGWQHPVIHFTTFRDECRAFWDALVRERNPVLNQAWLALYLSLLSVGVHHMSLRQAAACGLSAQDAQNLPRLWFADCIAALERSRFMTNHTLQAIQTIAVLGFSGYDIGPANQISVLHSCAVRIAQNLKLHRLGADPTHEISPQARMEREIGKRVWWALVVSDWNWIPHFRSWSISPEHFTTPMPSNWRDDEFPQLNFAGQPMPDDGISMVMQQVIVGQVTAVMQRFFARLLSDASSDHEDTIAEAESDLQRIVAGFPPALQQNPPSQVTADTTLPPYVPALRHYLQITTSHKRLVMHRQFLQHSTSRSDASGQRIRPQVRESRAVCVAAARHIIGELAQVTAHEVRPTWSTPYQAAGAATLLMLDVLERQANGCLDDETAARRHDLELGIRALEKLGEWSAIANRGVSLVRSLLSENLAFGGGSSQSVQQSQEGYSGSSGGQSQKRENEGSAGLDSPQLKRQLYDTSGSSFGEASPSRASPIQYRNALSTRAPASGPANSRPPGSFSFPAPQPLESGNDLFDFTASFNFSCNRSSTQEMQQAPTSPTTTAVGASITSSTQADQNIETLLNSSFGLYDFGSVFSGSQL